MQKYTIISGLFLLALMATFVLPASAQYDNDDDDDDVLSGGLYSGMLDSKTKVYIATKEGAIGSGTPYFAADGILGASLLSGGLFGGIAAMLFIRGKKGRYAAIGRG